MTRTNMSAPMKVFSKQRLFSSLMFLEKRTVSAKYVMYHRFTQAYNTEFKTSMHSPQTFVNTFARGKAKVVVPTFDLIDEQGNQVGLNCRFVSSAKKRYCWKCGKETDLVKELFFCKCGVVQSVSEVSYFTIMGIEESFDIDVTELSKKFKELQRLLHPDRYSQKSEREQELSELQSSIVNKAYSTLLKPLSRALYMLELHGQPLEEDNSDVDQAFLMEIMEINEEIMDSELSVEDLRNSEVTNKERIDKCIANISQAFRVRDVTVAKEHVIRLKYFSNIDDKIKEIYRKSFGM